MSVSSCTNSTLVQLKQHANLTLQIFQISVCHQISTFNNHKTSTSLLMAGFIRTCFLWGHLSSVEFNLFNSFQRKDLNTCWQTQKLVWSAMIIQKILKLNSGFNKVTRDTWSLYWCMSAGDEEDDRGCSAAGRTVSFGNRMTSWLTNFSTALSRTLTTISATAAAADTQFTYTTHQQQFLLKQMMMMMSPHCQMQWIRPDFVSDDNWLKQLIWKVLLPPWFSASWLCHH